MHSYGVLFSARPYLSVISILGLAKPVSCFFYNETVYTNCFIITFFTSREHQRSLINGESGFEMRSTHALH